MDFDEDYSPYARYFRWGKTVPYVFTVRVSKLDREFIRKQMDVIQDNTCIQFNEVTQAPEHHLQVDITSQISCMEGWFSAGVNYGGHGLKVELNSAYRLADDPRCEEGSMLSGGVLHELFHALGAIHTHQRTDRDKYIRYEERCSKAPSQFTKERFNLPSEGIHYEYESIMHYGCDTFSVCMGYKGCDRECPTITPLESNCDVIGQTDYPTMQDWDMIRQYHQCEGGPSTYPTGTTETTRASVTPGCQYQNMWGEYFCSSNKNMCWFI